RSIAGGRSRSTAALMVMVMVGPACRAASGGPAGPSGGRRRRINDWRGGDRRARGAGRDRCRPVVAKFGIAGHHGVVSHEGVVAPVPLTQNIVGELHTGNAAAGCAAIRIDGISAAGKVVVVDNQAVDPAEIVVDHNGGRLIVIVDNGVVADRGATATIDLDAVEVSIRPAG